MADTSNKPSAFGTILEKVKDVAQSARDKVKDLNLFDKVKGLASTTVNWIKEKTEAIKNIVSKDKEAKEQDGTDAAIDEDNKSSETTSSDGTVSSKEEAMMIVGLDLADGKENVDQAIVNIAQMQFMRESIKNSKDGKSFDADAVGEKVMQFIDYYGDCSELDPESSDYETKLAEIDKKYGNDIVDAFDKASDAYEFCTSLHDKLPGGKVTLDIIENIDMKQYGMDQSEFAENFADLAYACGDLDIIEYANVLKAKGEVQVGVSAEDYADGVSVSDPETENGLDDEPEFETHTNMDLDHVDFGENAGASAVFMKYAMLKYAEQNTREGFIDPDTWNEKVNEFGSFVNEISAISGEDSETKLKELKDKSPDHVVKMFESCEAAIETYAKERDAVYHKHHVPGMPGSEDTKILNNWSRCEYSDEKPSDPDIAYALGDMNFMDYAKQNGDNTLWLCQSKEEFQSYVNAARMESAQAILPEDSAETTNEMEANGD